MKIIPVTLLKAEAKGMITDILNEEKKFEKAVQRLNAVGFVPGREVELGQSVGGTYRIKVGSDNPFAMRKNLADQILVAANDGDFYESYAEAKKANSVIGDIKKLLAKLKRK